MTSPFPPEEESTPEDDHGTADEPKQPDVIEPKRPAPPTPDPPDVPPTGRTLHNVMRSMRTIT